MNSYYMKLRHCDIHHMYRLIKDTFEGYELDAHKDSFLLDICHLYVVVDSDRNSIDIHIKSKKLFKHTPDVELAIYQDIQTIPLMDYAISESKK